MQPTRQENRSNSILPLEQIKLLRIRMNESYFAFRLIRRFFNRRNKKIQLTDVLNKRFRRGDGTDDNNEKRENH